MKFTTTTTLITTVYKIIFIGLLALVANSTFAQNFISADIAGDSGDSIDVVMGDVNGDGFLDIYVANNNEQNKLWINDGNGNFTDNDINDDSGFNISEVDMGDVNGDGFLDIYVSRQGESKLWINDGVGNFSTATIPLMMTNIYTAALGDVNGDNHLDIFTVHMDDGPGVNRLWINDGVGDFTPVEYGNFDSRGATMGDVNGDGFLDIYLTSVIGQNRILINDGNGNFTADDISGGLGNTYNDATIGDVNGDGFLDFYVPNSSDEQNKLLINDGTGNFTADDIVGDMGDSYGATMGDVNGDGFLDIYVANSSNEQNKFWINDGEGNFTANDIVGDTGNSYDVAMGDVNGDGFLDIYVANYSQPNKLWLQIPLIYTIRFIDHDSTVLNTQTATSGEDAIAPTNPTREGYTFTGWDPADLTNITADTDFTAQYTLTPVSTTGGSGGSGTSIPDRVNNLFDRGEDDEAVAIIEKRPRYFTSYLDATQAMEVLLEQLDDLLAEYKELTGQAFVSNTIILGIRNLDVNDSGTDVELLQRFLMSKGHNIEAGVTGFFGSQTKSALAQFQAEKLISPALGYYGPITRDAITKLYTNVVWRLF